MTVLLLGLHFFNNDPNCVNDTVNISQFPYFPLSARYETYMVTRRWDTALDANTMTSYTNAAALMK